MLGKHELALDTFCEVYDLLKPWRDFEFWDFANHTPVKDGIYLIGREQFRRNIKRIRELAETNYCHIILSNPHEGSATLKGLCQQLNISDLVEEGRILLIGGGNMEPGYPCLQYDSFLPKVLDYVENIQAIDNIRQITNKPYKFLFLNGRARSHRKYLIESFKTTGLLNSALWTNLDTSLSGHKEIQYIHQGQDLLLVPGEIQYLPQEYEIDRYQPSETNVAYVKYNLFNNEWGEIYLKTKLYQDTYFSLVTETVFDYPYSFRTEKIWKPIAIGHPFIAVANYGYYRDLHNLGFKTFGHVIDESFDLIQNNQKRIERIAQIIEDLCQQDLDQFSKECYNVCKYNQQHLAEMRLQVRKEFPDRFFQFIKKYINE